MSTFFWNFIAKTCWLILSLRYRIQVKGLEKLRSGDSKQGVLFLPNHPAHMDPLFLFLLLWPTYRMRPVVVEYIYRLPLLKVLMKLVRAVSVPNFDTSINQIKVKRANQAIQGIADELKKGVNFILYPAGKLKHTAKEIVGGASGAHALVQECTETRIVLIRTTGLWGSSFSRAIEGRSPHLPATLWNGIKTLIKNGIFFAPRRSIEIEILPDPEGISTKASRLEFNRFLENWYNRYPQPDGKVLEEEPLRLVSYSFWKTDLPQPFQCKTKSKGKGSFYISDETCSKIYAEIRRILNNPGIQIQPNMNLATDLGFDSLNVADLIAYVSKNYVVDELHPEDFDTVEGVLEIAEGARASDRTAKSVSAFHWPEEQNRPSPQLPEGLTFPEVFLKSCQRMGGSAACADDLVGAMTYKQLQRSVLVLSLYFRKLPGPYVGVLLPASVAAYLVILALQFAGKIPVMLNWTLGPRFLEEMMKETGAKTVISSWRFLDRLNHVDFGSLVDQIELLEDIKGKLGLNNKLKGVLFSHLPPSMILKNFGLHRLDENQPAVILYTSGTEAKPKGVPLSHKNILSNQRSAFECMNVLGSDVLYGILPPFHSFGFSVVGLFPILAGVKIAFYPDPTDGFALAEGCNRWNVTLFCGPPSFIKGLLNSAKPEQIKRIRWFISGAEKAPPELFERVARLETNARIIEGYGITECSPILTITRADLPAKGVGQPIPGSDLCTIHVETEALLPEGETGEICVRGPNVFKGYLGHPRDPFIEINGKQWYRTGDIGKLDPDGNLIISGRIKRFTKLGGEMISLGGVEEALVQGLIQEQKISPDVPSIAVVADEKKEGHPQLIVFSIVALSREEANHILHSRGFSRLVKIASIRRIDEIPLTGTGKTNYRSLQNLLV